MIILQRVAFVIVALLSLAAGAAKVMKAPQEVLFFEVVGLGPIYMTILGALQLIAGVLVFVPRTRKLGATLAAVAFLISVLMILKSGQTGFAIISLLPVAISVFVFVSYKKS